MTAPDLKPCPFCGATAKTHDTGLSRPLWHVECDQCYGAVDHGFETEAEAIAAWNTRAPLADALAVMADATLYGTGIMQDGQRIDPQDFFASPDPAAPTGHWKDACRESNGPEICDEPCGKCLRAIGERDEATRRRDAWKAKAEGYDAVRLALREKVGAPWPPNLSRIMWAGIAADEKRRADDAEAKVAALVEALEACTNWMESGRASGDWGFWEWDEGDEYTRARAAIAAAKEGK